jgi:hypothetical protein
MRLARHPRSKPEFVKRHTFDLRQATRGRLQNTVFPSDTPPPRLYVCPGSEDTACFPNFAGREAGRPTSRAYLNGKLSKPRDGPDSADRLCNGRNRNRHVSTCRRIPEAGKSKQIAPAHHEASASKGMEAGGLLPGAGGFRIAQQSHRADDHEAVWLTLVDKTKPRKRWQRFRIVVSSMARKPGGGERLP